MSLTSTGVGSTDGGGAPPPPPAAPAGSLWFDYASQSALVATIR